jgi:ParB/RepB/Spo0J family partition protein
MEVEETKQMMVIPLNRIVQKENSRGDYRDADIEELMVSMRQHSMLQPIGVRPGPAKGEYEVVYGNRRVQAAKKLGWTKIDALVVGSSGTKESDIDFLIKNATENMQRKDPSFPEQGRLFQSLIRKGLNSKEIAARIGVPITRVNAILEAYDEVPKWLKDKITLGDVGPKTTSDKISLKNTTAVLNATKSQALPDGTRDKLFKLAMKPGVGANQIRQTANLVARGISFTEASKYIGSVKVVSVNFLMTEKAISVVERQTGKNIREAIHDIVAKSKAIPLAKVVLKKSSPR